MNNSDIRPGWFAGPADADRLGTREYIAHRTVLTGSDPGGRTGTAVASPLPEIGLLMYGRAAPRGTSMAAYLWVAVLAGSKDAQTLRLTADGVVVTMLRAWGSDGYADCWDLWRSDLPFAFAGQTITVA